jgi:urea carboxylase-associated protein 2
VSTASLEGARAHARSQAGAGAPTHRTIPASTADDLPAGIAAADVRWDETVAAGRYASHDLPRGSVLRITDVEGDGCVHLVVHHARATAERLNVADTVKVQWQAYLGPGAVLLSDMGRALMTIVDDTSARHDALCGTTSAPVATARYGTTGIHSDSPTVRQLLAVAAAKHGMAVRDLPPGINLFKSAVVADDGTVRLDGAPRPGTAIDLRADLDVVVMVANVPHPLDDRATYTSSTVRLTAWDAEHPGLDDPWRTSSPERQRAYENADDFLAGVRR